MRTAVGGSRVFELVIIFMLIFVGYLTVMINYSTAFKTKNEVLGIIEKYEGLASGDYDDTTKTAPSIWIINKYLANTGYKGTGDCKTDWYGATDLSSGARLTKDATNAYYCVKPTIQTEITDAGVSVNKGYYDIELFLKVDLPVLGRVGAFTIKGQTNKIRYISTEGLQGY